MIGVAHPTQPLTLLVEPGAGDRPFVALVDDARSTVTLTMYELADTTFEQALVSAARRGVQVRVLLDAGHADDDRSRRYLAEHGVAVRVGPGDVTIHQKTLTVDDRVAAIMTLNLQSRYYATTRDFAVLDSDHTDVAAVLAAFEADWDSEGRDVATRSYRPSTGSGELVWSPGALPAVLRLIDSARASLDVYAEEMDDRDTTDALCRAARRGVSVRVLITYASRWRSALARLAGCGVAVHELPAQRALYIHAKAIVVDGARALVGSQNLSQASLGYNRELSVLTDSPSVVTALVRVFDADWRSQAAGDE